MTVKKIDIKEFREKGYLQEINRRFLHPLGLALEIVIEENGEEHLGGIWDYREEDEGIYYDLKNSSKERIDSFKRKFDFIEKQYKKRKNLREKKLGFFIEPIE